jgi:hypothetical protein
LRLRLEYGVNGLEVDLPAERVTVIEPAFRPSLPDPHAALVEAIRAPLGRPPLRELTRPGQTVAISVCDITRAQPRREMLRALFEGIFLRSTARRARRRRRTPCARWARRSTSS